MNDDGRVFSNKEPELFTDCELRSVGFWGLGVVGFGGCDVTGKRSVRTDAAEALVCCACGLEVIGSSCLFTSLPPSFFFSQ